MGNALVFTNIASTPESSANLTLGLLPAARDAVPIAKMQSILSGMVSVFKTMSTLLEDVYDRATSNTAPPGCGPLIGKDEESRATRFRGSSDR
jgi:hypothetical protein